MVVITKSMKAYILAPSKKGYNKSEYDKRIIQHAKSALQDLTFLLENTPEYIQGQIFNKELEPFFRALFRASNYLQEKTKEGTIIIPEDIEKKSSRMLKVINLALSEIKSRYNAILLAPKAWKVIKQLPSSTHDAYYGTNVIQALQIEGHNSIKSIDDAFSHAEVE